MAEPAMTFGQDIVFRPIYIRNSKACMKAEQMNFMIVLSILYKMPASQKVANVK